MKVREARPEDAAGMARVIVDTWQTAYRGLIPGEYLEKLSYAERERSFYKLLQNPEQDKFAFVAESNEGNIIGAMIGGLERTGHPLYGGEIYAIYVLEEFQGNGIGKSLFHSAIEWLENRQINSLLLWALDGNKYINFYKELGAKELDRKTHDFKEFTAELVAYGWEDLSKDTRLQFKFSVRKATKDDLQILIQMRLQLQQHMEKANAKILKHNEAWKSNLPAFYTELINNPNSLVLLAVNAGNRQPIGMSIGQLIEDKHFDIGRYVKINDVWVNEKHRKKGICALMINEIIKIFREKGIATFTLNYVINNFEAEGTWRALGFEPIIQGCLKKIE